MGNQFRILFYFSYMNDCDAGRILRDAKLYEIAAGTNEIRKIVVGRELFKEFSK